MHAASLPITPARGLNDEQCMHAALLAALRAGQAGDMPFGAAVAFDGRLVAVEASCEIACGSALCHAETRALHMAHLELGYHLTGATLYSTLEPCVMCTGALLHSGVSRVVIAAARQDLPEVFRHKPIGFTSLTAQASRPPQVLWGVGRRQAIELLADGLPHPS